MHDIGENVAFVKFYCHTSSNGILGFFAPVADDEVGVDR